MPSIELKLVNYSYIIIAINTCAILQTDFRADTAVIIFFKVN